MRYNSKTGVNSQEQNAKRFDKQVELLGLGFNVFPCQPQTKIPIGTWKAYQTERVSTDLLECWYSLSNDFNYCLIMGSISGFVAVDCDNSEMMAFLKAKGITSPVRTKTSRGEHFLFKYDETAAIKNVGGLEYQGQTYKIDIKTDGGYVVSPGSVHESGFIYEQSETWTRELLDSAPPFKVVYDALELHRYHREASTVADEVLTEQDERDDQDERARKLREYLAWWPPTQQGKNGGAHAYMFKTAITALQGFQVDPETAAEALWEWGQDGLDAYGNPYPWTMKEIQGYLAGAAAASYSGRPGDMLEADGPDYSALDSIIKSVDTKNPFGDEKQKITLRRAYTIPELAQLPKADYLIEQTMSKGSFGAVFGVSGAAKSFWAIDAGMSIATGKPFQDRFQVKQGTVLYICSEAWRGMENRIWAWLEHHRQPWPENFRVIPSAFNLMERAEAEEILKIIRRDMDTPSVIIADTLSRNFGHGNEREAVDMMNYVGNLSWLIDQTDAAAWSIHHSGWNHERERGASNLRDSCDTMIQLLPHDPVHVATNTETKVTCIKQKDDEPFFPYWIKKTLVRGSCVWVPVVAGDEPKVEKVNPHAEFIALFPTDPAAAITWQTVAEMPYVKNKEWTDGRLKNVLTEAQQELNGPRLLIRDGYKNGRISYYYRG